MLTALPSRDTFCFSARSLSKTFGCLARLYNAPLNTVAFVSEPIISKLERVLVLQDESLPAKMRILNDASISPTVIPFSSFALDSDQSRPSLLHPESK